MIRAKKNNNSSIRAIKRKVHTLDPVEIWDYEKGFARVSVSESTFLMDNVNCPLRFVKYAMKHPDGRRSQILIVTSCLEMSLSTIFKMIRARWDIENSIFNNLKTECGLEHCYVHGGNAVEAILYLIFIASNIMQLFLLRRLKRHFETQREIVRMLLKGLYRLKYKKELVFSTA